MRRFAAVLISLQSHPRPPLLSEFSARRTQHNAVAVKKKSRPRVKIGARPLALAVWQAATACHVITAISITITRLISVPPPSQMGPLLAASTQIGGRPLAGLRDSHALVKTARRRVARPVALSFLPRPNRCIRHVKDVRPLQHVFGPLQFGLRVPQSGPR